MKNNKKNFECSPEDFIAGVRELYKDWVCFKKQEDPSFVRLPDMEDAMDYVENFGIGPCFPNISVIEKDLLEVGTDVIIHQANCFNTMGSGVAVQIKDKYPEAYEVDCQTVKGDMSKLGTISIAKSKIDNKIIINVYGQYNYGRDSRKTDYEAIYTGFVNVRKYMEEKKLTGLALPFNMGCFNAGGDWHIVKSMIESVFGDSDINVLICKKVD